MWQLKILPTMIVTLLVITISGCGDDSSERVAQVALEGSRRQAMLDQEMAHVNQEVTKANRSLIESQGQSQRQVLALAQDVEKQHQELDQERRDVASQRERESILAPVFLTVGSLAVCSLPLVLCWYLLRGLGREATEMPVTQLLLEQLLLVDDPLGLSGPSPARLLPPANELAIGADSEQPSSDKPTGNRLGL